NRKVFIGVMNSFSWNCLCVKLQDFFQKSLFHHVKFYNLWELKSHVQMAYGPVPVAWRCAQVLPSLIEKIEGLKTDRWNLRSWPFGSFLGLSVTILYCVKTDNLPLKIRMTETRQSVPGGLSMKNLNRGEGVQREEGGLSL
ncbi:MAG: hypothetical protein QGG48_10495, partial [Desulfatiglandales bacterium]|nr:hypothetical protein [Desulfatiglandales bacterium]